MNDEIIRGLDAKFIKGELFYDLYIKLRTEHLIEYDNLSKKGSGGLNLEDVAYR